MSTTMESTPTQTDISYLRNIGTGVINDALKRLGLRGSATRLHPLKPFEGAHVAGLAVTVRFLPARGTNKALTSVYDVMRKAGKGVVIVIDAQGCSGHLFGGNMAHLGTRVGLEAVVIDGAVRDYPEISNHGLPVFSSRGTSVAGAAGTTMLLADIDIPIACDGVQVRPGDVVVGDDDGVVFIPIEAYNDVMANTKAIGTLEQQMEYAIGADQSLDTLRELLVRKERERA